MEKAMARKERRFSKRWRANGYRVWRVLLFFIWIGGKLNERQKWSEERAQEVLSYYVPRNAEWDASESCLYFFDNGLGWGMKKKVKWRDRRWWNKNCGFFGGEIRCYLINGFELEGFRKEVQDTNDGTTEIAFYLSDAVCESIPFSRENGC